MWSKVGSELVLFQPDAEAVKKETYSLVLGIRKPSGHLSLAKSASQACHGAMLILISFIVIVYIVGVMHIGIIEGLLWLWSETGSIGSQSSRPD